MRSIRITTRKQYKKPIRCWRSIQQRCAQRYIVTWSSLLKNEDHFQALKALALIRSGRQDDAFPLIDYIEQHDELNDDTTLQALSHCLREVSARMFDFYVIFLFSQFSSSTNCTTIWTCMQKTSKEWTISDTSIHGVCSNSRLSKTAKDGNALI
jgi:hypothetical protein